MIITRTPFRISFFGGGTDYPAWFNEHGGEVLSTSIDKYCYITCRHLPPFFDYKHRIVYSAIENVHHWDEIKHPAVRAVLGWVNCSKGLEIHHDGDLPARSGLGSSSSFTVGLLHALSALKGQYISKEQLARDAIHIEQNVIGESVGSQDQVAAAYGGFNRIEFLPSGGFQVSPVIVSKKRLKELQKHLMLCFTGFSRIASEVAKAKIDNLGKRADELTQMRAMVEEAMRILHDRNRSIEEFGDLLHQALADQEAAVGQGVHHRDRSDLRTRASRRRAGRQAARRRRRRLPAAVRATRRPATHPCRAGPSDPRAGQLRRIGQPCGAVSTQRIELMRSSR